MRKTESVIGGCLQQPCSTASIPDAVLKVEGNVIIISDHQNTLRLNRDAAIELLKRLPKLIDELPIEI
jgi:hypothetical protein